MNLDLDLLDSSYKSTSASEAYKQHFLDLHTRCDNDEPYALAA